MTYLEVTITTDPEHNEVLQAFLAEEGYDSFVDTENGFNAYIGTESFDEEALKHLQNTFSFDYQSAEMEEKNWNEEWERNFQPIVVEDKCNIRAEFHPPNPDVQHEIIITPKMSFGTGHHPTTYMMVNELFNLDVKDKSVLDMGCGTLVLAILAKKLGSGTTVGIDNDEWAVNNSVENAERNGFPDIEVLHGDAALLAESQKFDVILANINRNILLADMHAYASALQPEGVLVCSGFYTEDNQLIIAEAEKHNLNLSDQNERGNWSLLEFKRGI